MLTEPNKSNIENLHARAGSRIRVTEPCLKSPAQLDMSSMTRAPFEAQRSTGLIFFVQVCSIQMAASQGAAIVSF